MIGSNRTNRHHIPQRIAFSVRLLAFLSLPILVVAFSLKQVGAQQVEERWMTKEISNSQIAQKEVEDYLESRISRMPQASSADEWRGIADRMREETLSRVIYRGAAAGWRNGRANVEWLGSIEGGPEYRIRKLRFEAVPGMWIPALLYEPHAIAAKTPVALNINGHDPKGKAAEYKQVRSINQAKRGMIVLNVEWFNMGQLRGDGYAHSRLNQIDLCGTSGLAPFYLSMKRSLDILLSHPHADPDRVVVSGLSGGGWQTIIISALDTRVTLTNPVAGYSSFLTRIRNHSDLGDSEQTPVDLGVTADYAQLTAMLAPRPALLTYNVKDDCCFASAHALPPLMEAAEPIYQLLGQPDRLRSHVNHDPGTHNFEKDNRQALYRMLGDHFYAGDKSFSSEEIECQKEVKTAENLHVDLPARNVTLHSLATDLAQLLPRDAQLPQSAETTVTWTESKRGDLKRIVAAKDYAVAAQMHGQEKSGDLQITYWRLRVGDTWTVPAVELSRGDSQSVSLVVHDKGRKSALSIASELLTNGNRVIVMDPFYFGESQLPNRAHLWGLLISTVGDRPLGIQASQVAAVSRWLKIDRAIKEVTVVAEGERSSLYALVAAAIEPAGIDALRCRGSFGSLKEILERNYTVDQFPELFCFGLLERFDIKQLAALVAPRLVSFADPSPRLRQELADLPGLYRLLGKEFSL